MPQVANFVPSDLEVPGGPGLLGWNGYQRHFLAEGDSWFTLAALPGGNLLQELHLDRWAMVVNTAYPGDKLSNIVEWRDNQEFVRLLAVPGFAYQWDAILLSAGGNDLIAAAGTRGGLLKQPAADPMVLENWINRASLQKFLDYVKANMACIVDLRDSADSPNKGIPIYAHTYDYPTARPAPAKFMGTLDFSGPWLYDAYVGIGLPEQLWVPMTEFLIDALAETLLGMNLANVHVIDTRGVMARAAEGSTGDSGDWLNEIHANRNGRKKLAHRWNDVLNQV
ncbi:MAG: hypothetical protein HZA64_02530 [Rhodocyclales bacterium]|nr:hypothetical protein [Rhodocyclales bacterium]